MRAGNVQRLATRELGRTQREARAVRDLVLRAVLRNVDDHRDGCLCVLLRVEWHTPLRRRAALVRQRRPEHEPSTLHILRDQRRQLCLPRACAGGAPGEERMFAVSTAAELSEDASVEARCEGRGVCADARPWT